MPGKPHPGQDQIEGCLRVVRPKSLGRSLDFGGNAEARGMAVDPPEVTLPGNKTRLIV